MKQIFTTVMCLAAVAMLTACGQSKTDKVIDGFEDLVEEVEKKKGELTAQEWQAMADDFNKRFEELGIEDIDESEFSTMEKLKLTGLVVRWGVAMAESAPTLMEGSLEKSFDETMKEAEKALEREDVQKAIEDFTNQ